jgi:hypothetical protein
MACGQANFMFQRGLALGDTRMRLVFGAIFYEPWQIVGRI